MNNAVEIRDMTSLTQEMIERIVPGYSTTRIYEVEKTESEGQINFSLSLKTLNQPFIKKHQYSDPSVLIHYNEVAKFGKSHAAYIENQCVGFILAEVQEWNSTLVVREFGVHPEYRRQHIGQKLISKTIEDARFASLRCVFCETQNTNVDAIEFYKKQGFVIEGIDLAFYNSKSDQQTEVAVFLRKKISKNRENIR